MATRKTKKLPLPQTDSKEAVASPPATATGHDKLYLWGFVAAVTAFVVATLLTLQNMELTGWEASIFHAVNGMPDALRIVGIATTLTPESMLIGAVVVVVAFFLRLYRLAWRLAVAIIGGYAVVALAKHFIGRPRPAEILQDVSLKMHDTGMGFPSGHTMIVTVIMLMLIPYIPGKWRLLVPLPIILMGWSRVYLGLHAPLDIVGGFAVGLGVVAFLRILPVVVKKYFRLD